MSKVTSNGIQILQHGQVQKQYTYLGHTDDGNIYGLPSQAGFITFNGFERSDTNAVESTSVRLMVSFCVVEAVTVIEPCHRHRSCHHVQISVSLSYQD
jgi:hypothetical protein